MAQIVVTVELALLLVLPLILFYRTRGATARRTFLHVSALYAIWYVSYALMHESCHLLGSWITGAEILDYQLVPRFWTGEFGVGYVNSRLESPAQRLLSPIAPYLRDLVALCLGRVLLARRVGPISLLDGLVLVLFVASPLFDLANNYLAFAAGARNDFTAISSVLGRAGTHVLGVAFMLVAAWTMRWALRRPERTHGSPPPLDSARLARELASAKCPSSDRTR